MEKLRCLYYFAENLKKERETFDEYYYSMMRFLNPMLKNPSYDILLKRNGELYYNDQKLVNQVLSYSVIPTGNVGYQMLYFIFENGKVGCANIEESSSLGTDITITMDLGYSDIVNIVGGVMGSENAPGTHGPIFIDIHGNMFHE